MTAFVTDLATSGQDFCYQPGKRLAWVAEAIVAAMATKSKSTAYLYISEWFVALKLNDAKVGEKLDIPRETIWRWRNEQHRLDPEKIALLAGAMGLRPEQLWHSPTRKSVDSILDKIEANDDLRSTAADIVERLVRDHETP